MCLKLCTFMAGDRRVGHAAAVALGASTSTGCGVSAAAAGWAYIAGRNGTFGEAELL